MGREMRSDDSPDLRAALNDALRRFERLQEMASGHPDHLERAETLLIEIFDEAIDGADSIRSTLEEKK